jgi:hypothetical protein
LAFALQLRKSKKNLSQGSRAATGLLIAPTWLSFEGLPRLAAAETPLIYTLMSLLVASQLPTSGGAIGADIFRLAVDRVFMVGRFVVAAKFPTKILV